MIPVPVVVGVNQQFLTPGLFVRARLFSFDTRNVSLQGLTLVPVHDGLADFHRLRIAVPPFTQPIRVALQFTVVMVVQGALRELSATAITSHPFLVSRTLSWKLSDRCTNL